MRKKVTTTIAYVLHLYEYYFRLTNMGKVAESPNDLPILKKSRELLNNKSKAVE